MMPSRIVKRCFFEQCQENMAEPIFQPVQSAFQARVSGKVGAGEDQNDHNPSGLSPCFLPHAH